MYLLKKVTITLYNIFGIIEANKRLRKSKNRQSKRRFYTSDKRITIQSIKIVLIADIKQAVQTYFIIFMIRKG